MRALAYLVFRTGILVFGFSSLIMGISIADQSQTTARTAFEQGRATFRQEDYLQAASYFQQAFDAGMSGPAIHYNIGVCQYRLGNLDASEIAFLKVADYPTMASLAYYNLGLVESERGNEEVAIGWFERTLETTEDAKLQILASRMLGTPSSLRRESKWHGILLSEAGYDDNVRLVNDALPLPNANIASPVLLLFGSVSGPYSSGSGFLFDASAYAVNYFDAHDLDQSELMIGTRYQWFHDDWRIEVGGHFSYGTLDGHGFEEIGKLGLNIFRRMKVNLRLDFRYTYEDVNAGDEVFSFLDGSRQRLRARASWRWKLNSLQVIYDYENNDRVDPIVSPDRHRIKGRLTHWIDSDWRVEGEVSYQNSDFADTLTGRADDLFIIGARVTRRLNEDWEFYADYGYADNQSNEDRFSYARNRIMIGTGWLF